MLEIKRLFFGRVWSVDEYCGNGRFNISVIDKKYRIFYLTEKSDKYVFIDLETGDFYPIDIDKIAYDKFFVYSGDVNAIDDVYPVLKFPYLVSKEDALKINGEYNKEFGSSSDVERVEQIDMNDVLSNKKESRILTRRIN